MRSKTCRMSNPYAGNSGVPVKAPVKRHIPTGKRADIAMASQRVSKRAANGQYEGQPEGQPSKTLTIIKPRG